LKDESEVNTGEALIINRDFVMKLAPMRPADGHKGTFGSILVWAGSPGMGGAAFMCANAACRSGTGAVHLWIRNDLVTPMFLAVPQAIAHKIPDNFENAREELSAILPLMSAAVIGPGLDLSDSFVRDGILYFAEYAKNLLVDAGALTVIAREPDVFAPVFAGRIKSGLPPAVFTPHPGEFSRLVPDWNKEDRMGGAKAFAEAWKVVVVLKGHKTIVSTPAGACYINSTGNDGLAKGGSGDVLSGLIGSLLAQGMRPDEAAVSGVYLHGLSGDYAASALGRRYMQPTDLFAFFTDAFRHVRWENEI
jgi:NAD(P)H-hydrate epimerase